MNENLNIALLIDCENITKSPNEYMEALEKELILFGKTSYKRMFADFTKQNSVNWKKIANDYALTPVQQYSYTTGKNSTDSRIVIDAMDILYTHNVNAFCIVSSDSDFTTLAKRLIEANMFVIGAGERKTPAAFVKACDRFLYLDDIVEGNAKAKAQSAQMAKSTEKKQQKKVSTPTAKQVETAPVVEVALPVDPEDDTSLTLTKDEVENFVARILEVQQGKPYTVANLMNKIYQAYPQFNIKDFGVKKSQDFFSKDRFKVAKGKSTEWLISLIND